MSTEVEPASKRQKTQHNSLIGTHNGTFHCDEALAVWMLRRTGTYKDAGQSYPNFPSGIVFKFDGMQI